MNETRSQNQNQIHQQINKVLKMMQLALLSLMLSQAADAFMVAPPTVVGRRRATVSSQRLFVLQEPQESEVSQQQLQQPTQYRSNLEVSEPFPFLLENFPGAMSNDDFVDYVMDRLDENGFDFYETLLATSFCRDEATHGLQSDLADAFDSNYQMGGLAGFPFGGTTGFNYMINHVPDGGNALIVYGPHVGIDSHGNVGTVERAGCAEAGPCCRSASLASDYVMGVLDGSTPEASMPLNPLDAEQYFVGNMLMPFAGRLKKAPDTQMELPFVLYEAQSAMMKEIVQSATPASKLGEDQRVAVLGGIQVNTPPGYTDYFLPLSFDVYNKQGEMVDNILLENAWE
jgi:hypothetical protein